MRQEKPNVGLNICDTLFLRARKTCSSLPPSFSLLSFLFSPPVKS